MEEGTRQLVEQLSPTQKQSFYDRYEDKKKDPTTALLLCFFLGGLGGHEFYLESGNGTKFLIGGIFTFTVVTGIVALCQLFTLQKRVKRENEQIAHKIMEGIKDKGPIGAIGAGNAASIEADLSKLQEMRDNGSITEVEYQQLRKKSLGL